MIEGLNKALELLDAEIKKTETIRHLFPGEKLSRTMALQAVQNAILVEIAMIEDAEGVKSGER